jgi:hypothetical protein
MPFTDSLLIQTSSWSTDGSERTNEDLSIYANDAILGMYSDGFGTAGSGIVLGQIGAGDVLKDRWAMYRGTTGDGADLRFTFGQGTYGSNPTLVEFDTLGAVIADDFTYSDPQKGYYTLGSYDFSELNDNYLGWQKNQGYPEAGGANTVVAPIHLPHEATITNFSCTFYDSSGSYDLECKLAYSGYDLTSGSTIVTVESNQTDGYHAESTSLSYPVNNLVNAYHVELTAPFWNTLDGDLRIRKVVVEYEMEGPE